MKHVLSRFHSWCDRVDERLLSSRMTPLLLFLLALFFKVIYVVSSNDSLEIRVPLMDAKYYDLMAQDIAAGNVLRPGAFFMGPLYPYLLAVVYSLFGHEFLIVRLMQATGGAMTVAVTFFLGRVVFRPIVALVGALALIFYGAMTFYEGQMLMMWLGTLIGVCFLLALILALRKGGFWRFGLAGALIGLSALARANVLLFVPVAAVWIFKDRQRRGGPKPAAVFVAAVMVTVLPAMVHNHVASRDAFLITSNGGVNFYIGNSKEATGIFYPPVEVDFVGDTTTRIYIERKLGRNLRPSEISRYWLSRALEDMGENPARAAGLMVRKVGLFFNAYEVPQLESFDLSRRDYWVLRALFIKYWFVVAFGLLGVCFALRRSRDSALLVLYLATYSVSIILFFVAARFRAQTAPLMCLFAADFLLVTVPTFAITPRRIAAAIGLAVLALLLTSPNAFEWNAEETSFREHLHRGRRLSEEGRYKDAIAEVDRAIAVLPDNPEGFMHRAIIHNAARDNLAALEDYSRANQLNPGIASVHYDMAQTLMRVNLREKAVDEYRAAIAIDPLMIKAHNNLGLTLRQLRRYDEAIASFSRVVELDPQYVRGQNNLAACYAEAGRVEDAIKMFRGAGERFPDYANTFKNLAMAYTSQKQTALAIAAITRYLEMEPDDDAAREMLRKLRIAAEAADSTGLAAPASEDRL